MSPFPINLNFAPGAAFKAYQEELQMTGHR
jgi:hypothetical protein